MTATGTRARVRAELTREITEAARRHLATGGAGALSLRAVARELGMASSAVYRYFPSRDDLLTALIVEAYDALGAAAEQADASCEPRDLRARWHAVCRSAREWALAHPHEYALVYGSPVPGYAAPRTTIGPASRVGEVLCRLVADGLAAGDVPVPQGGGDAVLAPRVAERVGLPAGDSGSSLAARSILAWTSVFGMISFELFGHTHNVVADHERFFADGADHLADLLGLPDGGEGGPAPSGRPPRRTPADHRPAVTRHPSISENATPRSPRRP
ncbi:TetR/AcrR family transcriptional regulator [Pseudonocardia sp. KRD-184]|uniref:TetR/AcrR family transcriptional regulator n=1 Tax=Pseudonocardia oceani TaxID=2792013 RepID=A0ABS6U6P5_9PSEU|nr:TetR/AcrR family transcriptional regulator [Pseudonocardia oceani]MBW0092535.1 TetR/AcrR family transcriptional regulator [Pseudonocardia oceani]MBW0099427.1 TetR/AcrR family transcriptional regulator [Pseudonocardia oceani]MBW0108265.1 TetR/AcrR family transcriptional regulator [Pseudonocardia oceani]MBW0122466.1 TetR/AcrR family transcriptional regulator [Pseudonocardia oceani]MBW0127631.1 TetR/AcrR family transcriptional regulator [Pseudonocardia oceani]